MEIAFCLATRLRGVGLWVTGAKLAQVCPLRKNVKQNLMNAREYSTRASLVRIVMRS